MSMVSVCSLGEVFVLGSDVGVEVDRDDDTVPVCNKNHCE